MKLLMGVAAILSLAACNGTKFGAAKGGAAVGSSEASSFGIMSQPGLSKTCNEQLKQRGLRYSGGRWKKRLNLPCGYMGIGYVDADVEVTATEQTCEEIDSLDEKLTAGPGGDTYQGANRLPVAGRQGAKPPEGYAPAPNANTDPNVKWHEHARRCSTQTRCAGLTPAQAVGRLVWMKKCENTVPEFKMFLELLAKADSCAGGTGVCIFQAGRTTLYPLVSLNGGSDNAPAPSVNANLASVQDLAAHVGQVNDACPQPAVVEPIDTLCTSGCFTPSQRLLVSADGRYESIFKAREEKLATVAVLSRASTLEAPLYENAKVARYTASIEDAKEQLLTFATESGARLTVTENHPLLSGAGEVREASSFKVREDLVRVDGGKDPIVSIERASYFGKVYNVAPHSLAAEDNLIVSEGLINGSHNFQTVLRSELNRKVLRSQLSKGF